MIALKELFSEGPYKFQMRFTRGPIQEFYRPSIEKDLLLAERSKLLDQVPELHCAVLAGCEDVLQEAAEMAGINPQGEALETCKALGRHWEPDFLILKSQPADKLGFVAGCVCFPSSWDIRDKIGRPVSEIHSVVPGLNSAIGSQIDGFLSRIKPGISWERLNWGLSGSPELNQHPVRPLPRLNPAVNLEEVWLRVEYQSLCALPNTGGVLFGIRLAIFPLAEVRRDMEAAAGLLNALQTMPEEMAVYKGFASARERLQSLLKV